MHKEIYAMAQRLGAYLEAHRLTVTTAESCTGGGVAQAITAIPGSSQWFEAGWVTYSNAMKTQLLGVDTELLDGVGAVSAQVVESMVHGALTHSRAYCGVAISGIAGPDGGSEHKPVGTVWFAWLAQDHAVCTTKRVFSGGREQVRNQAVFIALEGLVDYLARISL